MELEVGNTRIYRCVSCGADTPHVVRADGGHVYGIICSNCQFGALVRDVELLRYQDKWENDLRKILEGLDD